jgi:[acyl-carrier-protein] S-malonyltransferase
MHAFVFPGQGSQKPHMGQAWVDDPAWEIVHRASAVAGRDVEQLLLHATAEELRLTRNTQLATFVLNLVAFEALWRTGLIPAAFAGHSVGEYAALVASGALSIEEGVQLVAERGDAMQAACDERPGTMAAVIGLDDEDVQSACLRADGDVWVANYNAPGETVIAGSADAVEAAGSAAVEFGARDVRPLPVGGAFHTPYMAPARERVRKALDEVTFHDPRQPVFANVDGRAHARGEEWAKLLSAQICSPVRWRQSVMRLAGDGVSTFVELAPAGVVSRLVRRVAPNARAFPIKEPADLDVVLAMELGDLPVLDAVAEFGETLHTTDRLIVSPRRGVLALVPQAETVTSEGEIVREGDVIGTVAGEPVRSPFSGWVMDYLAQPGERLAVGQPIVWLRAL